LETTQQTGSAEERGSAFREKLRRLRQSKGGVYLATSPAVPWLLLLALLMVSCGLVGVEAWKTLR
jgi:hypothetical protein